MVSEGIEIRALQAIYVRGVVVNEGDIVKVNPIDAASIVLLGRGEFIEPSDVDKMRAGVREADELACPVVTTIRPLFKVRS